MSVSKQYSVRIPSDLAKQLDEKSKVSLFIVSAVREKLEREERSQIQEQLRCLADDPEANDISDFSPAQKKVMARGD